jgi:hypothetical protein
MQHSESIKNLLPAMHAAWADIHGIEKSAENPHFRSKYIPLEHLTAAVKAAFLEHGLLLVQGCQPQSDLARFITVYTRILHVGTGEWLQVEMPLTLDKQTPQASGSVMTYGRRYTLQAALGIVADLDDDAENGMKREPKAKSGKKGPDGAKSVPEPPPPAPDEEEKPKRRGPGRPRKVPASTDVLSKEDSEKLREKLVEKGVNFQMLNNFLKLTFNVDDWHDMTYDQWTDVKPHVLKGAFNDPPEGEEKGEEGSDDTEL